MTALSEMTLPQQANNTVRGRARYSYLYKKALLTAISKDGKSQYAYIFHIGRDSHESLTQAIVEFMTEHKSVPNDGKLYAFAIDDCGNHDPIENIGSRDLRYLKRKYRNSYVSDYYIDRPIY